MQAQTTEQAAVTEQTATAQDKGAQYLTFMLAGEHYAVEILRVREIRGWSPVTRIPKSPAFLLGVLNLRGAIVPIIDLRMRLSLEAVAYTSVTVTIVLAVESSHDTRNFGIVVDAVSDVMEVPSSDLQAPPEISKGTNTEFISGLAAVADNMVMLLDIDKLLDEKELSAAIDSPEVARG
ncbi:MAG: chemotaxis protein CheW [Nitrococcus sp.]|nr:chemotaxis protein CheW [Nitrococcus sp.]